jgi:hypothetical protein
MIELTREEARALLYEWNENPSLRKHGILVEAAVRGYAADDGLDAATVDRWGIAGLLHTWTMSGIQKPPRTVRSVRTSSRTAATHRRSSTPCAATTTLSAFLG